MTDADIGAAVGLLAAGFPERDVAYWRHALHRLRERTVPDALPRYGYVLTDANRLVGIVLVIFATTDSGFVRGNVSSWYVEPPYRGYSHMLLAAPLRFKDVGFVNISPAPRTLKTINAQGFVRYVDGTFIACPAVAAPVHGVKVRRVRSHDCAGLQLLRDHAAWGCLSFELTQDDHTYPFVFVARRFAGGFLPCAQLIYCRGIEEFVRFAGPLGRRLLRHGVSAVLIDANGPVEGLRGVFRPGRSAKFCRGDQPRLGDLSYTELAIFGS